ncbi:MAG: nitroreductase family protein [Myxococcota bacterium]
MDFTDVVRTTFAARQFTEEALPDAVLHEILDEARFAPSGGNRQPWRVVVVESEAKRARLAELIVPTMRRYLAERSAGENPCNTIEPSAVTDAEVARSPDPTPMAHLLVGAPALLMVFVDLRVVASFDRDLPRVGVISGASIYPFVWNILLAARNRGYGGTITTFAAGAEPEVQKLFDVAPHMAVAAMLPLGRPLKQLTKLRRKAVEEFATIDEAAGEPLRPAG